MIGKGGEAVKIYVLKSPRILRGILKTLFRGK